MSKPEVLCLNASPHLKGFDRPMLHHLTQHFSVAQWEYQQTPDEPCSLDLALVVLHDYLNHHHPVHLIGHGISGLLALLYAQRYPEQVRSLTLLSVGVYPAVDWQAHYYAQRQLLPCSRRMLLTRMVDALFGCSSISMTKALVKLLERDLDHSLSPHSLVRQMNLAPIRVTVPLLVCGSVDDVIVTPHQLRSWQQHFSDSKSQLWVCPGGRYFFHYFYAQQVGEQILSFWRGLDPDNLLRSQSDHFSSEDSPASELEQAV